jgi:hypothetical protein
MYVWHNILLTKKSVKDILSSTEELTIRDYGKIFNARA